MIFWNGLHVYFSINMLSVHFAFNVCVDQLKKKKKKFENAWEKKKPQQKKNPKIPATPESVWCPKIKSLQIVTKEKFDTFHQVHFKHTPFSLCGLILDDKKHFVKKWLLSRHKLTYSRPLKLFSYLVNAIEKLMFCYRFPQAKM